MKNLTNEELQTLRQRARNAVFSGDYGRFQSYANAEQMLLAVNDELAQRKIITSSSPVVVPAHEGGAV
jgi:hypothetical protein